MTKVRVKNNHLHFNGVNYFRGNSENIQLGTYGEKRTPVLGINFLEVEGHLDPNLLKDIQTTSAEIDFTHTSEGDFTETLNGQFKGVDVALTGNQMWEKISAGEVNLVKFSIPLGKLEDAANDDQEALAELKMMSKRARIVSDIWVVTSATLAEEFHRAQSVNARGEKGKISLDINGTAGQSGTTEVKLPEGTTFAYLLSTLDWDKKKKKKRKKIIDLDTDQWGLT